MHAPRLALHWQVLLGATLGVALGLLAHALAPGTAGEPSTARDVFVHGFDVTADVFLRLLKLLVVPLVFASIVSGVVQIRRLDALGRLGLKTLSFYLASSLAAILVGLALVNWLRPGDTAQLDLGDSIEPASLPDGTDLAGLLLRSVPDNAFHAFATNGAILQVIFLALLVGVAITRLDPMHRRPLERGLAALLELISLLTGWVIRLVPIGVLAMVARVVATSGLEAFLPLLWFALTVVLGLAVHSLVVLPLALYWLGGVSPLSWARAVWPALVLAFSSSSSSGTLPVTTRAVVDRGRVSPSIASFTLPLGATINMDGTALYECVGVIFLAQHYAAVGGFELTMATQCIVVITALVASIGVAGVPAAGTVMMSVILYQIGLPEAGVALILAVDRPLDMLRTAVNVWSDTVCAVVIANSERGSGGEKEDLNAEPDRESITPDIAPDTSE